MPLYPPVPGASTSRRVVAARVVLFGLAKSFVIECEAHGRGFATAYVSVRDSMSACRALAETHIDVLVVSMKLPFWDRNVVDEHARHAGVPLHWLSVEDEADGGRPLVLECERLRLRSRPKHLQLAPAPARRMSGGY